MKIKPEDKDTIRGEVEKWAKKNKAKLVDRGESIGIDGGAWNLEIAVADGWAYVHGGGELHGISTNIEDTDELGSALKRLQGARK